MYSTQIFNLNQSFTKVNYAIFVIIISWILYNTPTDQSLYQKDMNDSSISLFLFWWKYAFITTMLFDIPNLTGYIRAYANYSNFLAKLLLQKLQTQLLSDYWYRYYSCPISSLGLVYQSPTVLHTSSQHFYALRWIWSRTNLFQYFQEMQKEIT